MGNPTGQMDPLLQQIPFKKKKGTKKEPVNLKNLNIHILKWKKQLSCLEMHMWMNKIVKKFKDMINIKLKS